MVRKTRHLVWTAAAKPVTAGIAPLALMRAVAPAEETPRLDIPLAPREETIYLLHIGAEVEHALMVQYLYAAFSLGGPHLTAAQQPIARGWREVIAGIAREEMGHLATVENLLVLIGGPLSFDREDYPAPSDLYPFAFELEPATKRSIGKYVLAEMPADDVAAALGLTKEIDAIREYVGDTGHSEKVHRVGRLYEAIQQLFTAPPTPQEPLAQPPSFVHSDDMSAASRQYQVRPSEWGLGFHDLLIETAVDRTSAINAIQAISVQGEGSTIQDLASSHFGRFLAIYRQFPDEHGWKPARDVARNPTTDPDAPIDRRITNPIACQWAGLLNLRYRMLLMFLSHSFHVEAPPDVTDRTPRGLLISWAFGEMYNVRSIAEILMALPLRAEGDGPLAGPPFEMPYSLALSTREDGRWRQHRDLFLASQLNVDALRRLGAGPEPYLAGLAAADAKALDQITALLGGFR